MATTINRQEPLVSIFTPAYDAELYIRECIESVLEQTYTNWEYLIVNNCSTDNTLEIAKKYAKMDKRIIIHNNKDFLSQMKNCNHGLRQINPNSKYCKIIHADDWLYPECIEKMVSIAEKNPKIGIVSSYRLDEKTVNLCGLPPRKNIFSGKEICRRHLLGEFYLFGSPSSLLIRTDIIEKQDPFYDETNVHADVDACFRILSDWDFGFVHQVLSYTRRHNESSTSIAKKIYTEDIHILKYFKKYGHQYLNTYEFNKTEKIFLKNYYYFLSKRICEFKKLTFWKYHQEELRKMGVSINWLKLSFFILVQLLNLRDTYHLIRDKHKDIGTYQRQAIRKKVLSRII